MDEQTKRELSKITAGIPKEISDNIVKTVVDTSEEDVARQVMSDPKCPLKQKENLKRLIETGQLRQTTTEINEDAARKSEEYHNAMVARAIRNGDIKPADPRRDPFLAKRMDRMRKQ